MTLEDDVRQHREARERRLRAPDGWLALVGRTILAEGANALDVGTATLEGGVVTFAPADGGAVHVWRPGEPASFVVVNGKRCELLRQADKIALRVRDPDSPTLRAFGGLAFFDFDAGWCTTAKIEGPARTVTLAVGLGVDVDHASPGLMRFTLFGREHTLLPVLDDDAPGRLFILFKDKTNGTSTYGAGRFLYTPLPDEHGNVVVDFNKCFNPPCALTEFASCPVAPFENRLPVEVAAGEKYPALTRG